MTDDKKASTKNKAVAALATIRPMVAGIDIGASQHWVCGPQRDDAEPNVRVFGTTTPELNELVEWLVAQGVTSAAMESTYVYWIPLYELLESRGIEPVLVNARQLHNVPGRTTISATASGCSCCTAVASYVARFAPPSPSRGCGPCKGRWPTLLPSELGASSGWQKALDQMNIQVHRAVTELTGKNGMAIVRAIVGGERDPLRLVAYRDSRCRKSAQEIARYLTGNWREEQLFNLASAVRLYDTLDEMSVLYDQRLLDELRTLQPSERQGQPVPRHPHPSKERSIKARGEQHGRTTLWQFAGVDLTRIDGISTTVAQVILTEVGTNVTAFPSEHHFVSWLRLCPRTPISGGKPLKKRRNSMGANRIAGVLRMAAVSAQRSKTALGAAFRRIARHKGGAVAVFATARQLGVHVYRMLRFGHDYVDVGEKAYEEKFQARRLAALAHNAKAMGFLLVEDPAVVAT